MTTLTTLTQPPPHSIERVLLYGHPGSGKTRSIFDLAQAIPTAQIHYFDNDHTADRFLSSPLYSHLTNITIYPVHTYQSYLTTLSTITPSLTPESWLALDTASSVWDLCQSHFIEEIFSSDIGEYFLAARKTIKNDAKKLDALSGWTDWTVINALYKSLMTRFLYSTNSHIISTALSSPITSKETALSNELFAELGTKPTGQKQLPAQFQTVLHLHRDRSLNHLVTSAKDRERELLTSARYKSFPFTYLQRVAGWELTDDV